MTVKELKQWSKKVPLELFFWIASLMAVLTINPDVEAFSLCPLHHLGIEWCPGCGIGRAMNLLVRGKFSAAWQMHPAAGFAFGAIIHRIWVLGKQINKNTHYG